MQSGCNRADEGCNLGCGLSDVGCETKELRAEVEAGRAGLMKPQRVPWPAALQGRRARS